MILAMMVALTATASACRQAAGSTAAGKDQPESLTWVTTPADSLLAERTLRLPVPNGDASAYRREIKAPRSLEAPVQRGEKVGEAVYYYKGQKVASVPLKAESYVGKENSFLGGLARFWHKITSLFA